MEKVYRTGALGALLDEYERAVAQLKYCIQDIPDEYLPVVVDTDTTDENCRSVQTVLAHVVAAMRNYAIYTIALYGRQIPRPEKIKRATIAEYMDDLDAAFTFNTSTLKDIKDEELVNPAFQVHTHWGQVYDIEQMLEHGLVHVLRHRRQLERFKMMLHTR